MSPGSRLVSHCWVVLDGAKGGAEHALPRPAEGMMAKMKMMTTMAMMIVMRVMTMLTVKYI